MGLPTTAEHQQERTELGTKVMAAAERFCNTQNVGLTSKRLLYEFLALADTNGRTLSGLCKAGAQRGTAGV